MSKQKMYKKGDLRKTLEKKMQKTKPGTNVSAKEFARWFGIYCDMKGKSDDIRNAKELEQAEVAELGDWMGYALIEWALEIWILRFYVKEGGREFCIKYA